MAEQHDILWAIMADSRVSASAKCVATVLLLKYRNQETKVCNPSFASIAKCLGRKRRSVIDAVNELKQFGFASWTGTLGGSTDNTNHFSFSLPTPPVQSAAPVQDTAPVQSSAPTGAVQRTRPVQSTAHELSIKPSKNQGSAPARFLPDDFRLEDATYSWALERLGSNEAVDRSVSRFVNHYRQVAGKQSTSRDWQAKVRNWIDDDASKSRPDKSVHAAIGRLQDKITSFDAPSDGAWRDVLTAYTKFGHWTKHVDQFGPPPTSPECRVPERILIQFDIKKEVAA